MKVKTAELSGVQLDYAVAVATNQVFSISTGNPDQAKKPPRIFYTKRNWDCSRPFNPTRSARVFSLLRVSEVKESNLLKACRAVVASKLGDEVDIPDELMESK